MCSLPTFTAITFSASSGWYGRWGCNFLYGTWLALWGLRCIGEDMDQEFARRATQWIRKCQNEDGGWGEDAASYYHETRAMSKESTPSQTAWATLALMAAGEVENPAVQRGIEFLVSANRDGNKWNEPWFTAVGFPRVFYLRYDGYSRYFPIWALARYANLSKSNSNRVSAGM